MTEMRVVRCGLPVLCGVIGATTVLVATSRHGIGLTTDSAFYVSAAESLLAGRGYVTFQHAHMDAFAPLYPTLLAVFGLGRHDLFDAARWIAVLCVALLNLRTTWWLFTRLRSEMVAATASLLVVCAVPFQLFFFSALSDLPFVLFTACSLFDADAFLRTADRRVLARAALFAGLAWATRYAGITVVASLVIVVLARRAALSMRVRDAALCGFIAAAPIAPWLASNYMGNGRPIGPRGIPEGTWWSNLGDVVNTLSTWLLPSRFPISVRITGLLLVTLLTCFLFRLARRPAAVKELCRRTDSNGLLVFLCFTFVYLGILIVAASTVLDIEPLNHRYLAPAYIPLIVIVTRIVDWNVATLSERFGSVFVNLALIASVLYPVASTARRISDYEVAGPGEFSRSVWQESELMQYLRDHPLSGNVFTNEPYAVYLMTRLTLLEAPAARKYRSLTPVPPSLMELNLQNGQSDLLVWFDHSIRDDLVTVQELRQRYQLQEMQRLEDGAVYTVSPRPRS